MASESPLLVQVPQSPVTNTPTRWQGILQEMAMSAIIQKHTSLPNTITFSSSSADRNTSTSNTLVKTVYQMPVSAISTNGYTSNGLSNSTSSGSLMQQGYIAVSSLPSTQAPGMPVLNHNIGGQVIQGQSRHN